MQPIQLLEKLHSLMQGGFAADAKLLLEAQMPALRTAEVELEPIEEAGRMLSAANAAKIKAARDALDALLSAAEPVPKGEPAMEAAQDESPALVTLCESAFFSAGGLDVLTERAETEAPDPLLKLIGPGWGSSGYYSAEMLRRDGPRAFPAGTLNFWDHNLEADRPEGSLDKLASVLKEDARWLDAGPDGPGLYAKAKVFSDYASHVKEKGPHIGVSIQAQGGRKHGEADGRKGWIVENLVRTPLTSADYVTVAGARGKVLLSESAHPGAAQSTTETGPNPGGEPMELDAKEVESLREAISNEKARNDKLTERLSKLESDNARLAEGQILRDAQDIALHQLEKIEGLPALTQRRIAESVAKDPPVKDGKVNREVFAPLVEAAARREMAYLSSVGALSGAIRGMGGTALDEDVDPAKVKAQLQESFQFLGMSERGAKFAAEGRAV